MASLRRNKTLSPDGQTARFLYTIIKQLDLKAIDWNLVAGSLEITNGHAARMRYSRFKQHMEGATTQPRAPRSGKKEKEGKEGKEVKGGKEDVKKGKKRGFEDDRNDHKEAKAFLKTEPGQDKASAKVKKEGGDNKLIKTEQDAADITRYEVKIKSEPCLRQDDQATTMKEAPPTIRVKPEPDIDESNPDIWHILPRTTISGQASLHDQTPRSTRSPASTLAIQTAPPFGHLHHFSPPQSTVSLAELDISPRSPRSVFTAADALQVVPTGSFMGGVESMQQRGPVDGSEGGLVKVKAEPVTDVDWMFCEPGAGVVVKSEPVET